MPTERPKFLVRAADRAQIAEQSQQHPMNPNSQIHGWSLSELTGLQRVGLHHIRIPAGKESFVFHTHRLEEEFLYVLSGRGVVEVDDQTYEIGPGDFVGFSTPSVGHHLRNPFNEDLVYLSGGERREAEVADFPRHGKRMVRVGSDVSIFPIEAATGYAIPDDGGKK
jgi:uncharacterized cupin superfamily protein